MMVVSATRSYSDLVKWMKSARPASFEPWWFARHDFVASFVAGVIVLGIIGTLDPSSFGAPESRPFANGWPSYVLAGLVAVAAVYPATRLQRIRRTVVRVAEPWFRPLTENPAFEGAATALASCPAPLRTRFSLAWVWAPLALVVLAATSAFSAAYFFVDAVLAGGLIGWAHPLYALGFVTVSVVLFRVAATRLSTWRLAASVSREVAEGY